MCACARSHARGLSSLALQLSLICVVISHLSSGVSASLLQIANGAGMEKPSDAGRLRSRSGSPSRQKLVEGRDYYYKDIRGIAAEEIASPQRTRLRLRGGFEIIAMPPLDAKRDPLQDLYRSCMDVSAPVAFSKASSYLIHGLTGWGVTAAASLLLAEVFRILFLAILHRVWEQSLKNQPADQPQLSDHARQEKLDDNSSGALIDTTLNETLEPNHHNVPLPAADLYSSAPLSQAADEQQEASLFRAIEGLHDDTEQEEHTSDNLPAHATEQHEHTSESLTAHAPELEEPAEHAEVVANAVDVDSGETASGSLEDLEMLQVLNLLALLVLKYGLKL